MDYNDLRTRLFFLDSFENISCANPEILLKVESSSINFSKSKITEGLHEIKLVALIMNTNDDSTNPVMKFGKDQSENFDIKKRKTNLFCNTCIREETTSFVSNTLSFQFHLTPSISIVSPKSSIFILENILNIQYSFLCPTHSISEPTNPNGCTCVDGYYNSLLEGSFDTYRNTFLMSKENCFLCLACPIGCKKCSNSSNCATCNSGATPNNGFCPISSESKI